MAPHGKAVEWKAPARVNGVDVTAGKTQAGDLSVKKGDEDDHVWEIQGNGKS